MELRRAVSGDAALLHDVAAATFPLACPPDSSPADIQEFIDTHLTEARFDEYLADPARDLLLAVEGDRAVGYTMLIADEPTDQDVAASVTLRPTVELSKVYVRPDAHGSGIATQLIERSVGLARGRGAASVWLGVNDQNARANRFYEKSGFVAVGTKRFLLGTRWENDFVRVLEL
ncbi:MAG: GNAT family N-acetyltransferase [Cryobacterium sp.]|nr:GNAT family N-acetyltransferase [Cryobacterium sp.]